MTEYQRRLGQLRMVESWEHFGDDPLFNFLAKELDERRKRTQEFAIEGMRKAQERHEEERRQAHITASMQSS